MTLVTATDSRDASPHVSVTYDGLVHCIVYVRAGTSRRFTTACRMLVDATGDDVRLPVMLHVNMCLTFSWPPGPDVTCLACLAAPRRDL